MFRSFYLTALNELFFSRFVKSLFESFYATDREKIPGSHFPSTVVHRMKKD